MVNCWERPRHPLRLGVTLRLAVVPAARLAALNTISPVPEAAKPMAVLSFVQLKDAPEVPVKGILMAVPEQALTLVG